MVNVAQGGGGVDQINNSEDKSNDFEKLVLPTSSWETQLPDLSGCFRACVKMIGWTPPLGHAILTIGNIETLEGIKVIDSYLQSGTPIIVGVNRKPGSANRDGITDHFCSDSRLW